MLWMTDEQETLNLHKCFPELPRSVSKFLLLITLCRKEMHAKSSNNATS